METRNSALLLFDKHPIQDDIRNYSNVVYYPKTHPSGGGPIEFEVKGTAEDYIDVDNALLYIRLKVTKVDGSAIDGASKLALTNLPISTLFSDVSLTIHNTQVEGGQAAYPYIAYLSTLLNMHPAAKRTHLQACGWFMDEADHYDDDAGSGFKARQKVIDGSKEVELMGPIFLDFFRQERYLLANVPFTLKFLRSKPEFALMGYAAGDYKITISDMELRVRQMLMNPSVVSGHLQGLQKQHVHYPIQFSDFDTFTIPIGHTTYVKDHLYAQNSPKLLIVGMVDNGAFNGDLAKNPFHFRHFDLNYLSLVKNGKTFPGEALKPDFDNKLCLREYYQTMEALGYVHSDDTNGLTPDEFLGGSTVFAFDLTDDNSVHSQHKQVDKGVNLRLEVKFGTAFPGNVNLIIFGIFDSHFEITKLRNVIVDHFG